MEKEQGSDFLLIVDDDARLLAYRLLSENTDERSRQNIAETLIRELSRSSYVTAYSSATVDRARMFMHRTDTSRMSLQKIAESAGATPKYLTNEFKRVLGVPAYRYQLRLRLSRALQELPHCECITELALSLGYSSHSHFTAAFRDAFGLAPSALRKMTALGWQNLDNSDRLTLSTV